MKKYLLLIVLFVSVSGFSQSVNDYQYVIVPVRFNIFNENDKFRLNTTTKLLLEKYGFKTFLSTDVIPNEDGDNCKKLYADLVQDKNFLLTKVKIVLNDCRGNVVYETEYGKSREKDYAAGYSQALRETAKSFDKLNYKYNGKVGNPVAISEVGSQGLIKESASSTPATEVASAGPFYFAQPTATGFQIVDTEPKVILRLFNTSQKNVFIAEKGTLKGVVIARNGQWFFEYYENAKLISEPWNLKF